MYGLICEAIQDDGEIELRGPNTVKFFPVEALTSGTFPVKVELESPDGTLHFAQAKITVRSTATSGVGLFLSAGAALFLAVWWARHLHKGRRARRLGQAGRGGDQAGGEGEGRGGQPAAGTAWPAHFDPLVVVVAGAVLGLVRALTCLHGGTCDARASAACCTSESAR